MNAGAFTFNVGTSLDKIKSGDVDPSVDVSPSYKINIQKMLYSWKSTKIIFLLAICSVL